MQVLRTAADLSRLDAFRGVAPLVLVPTMGALHEGHLSLVRHGLGLGPVVVSIFVNPTQFGPGEDFESYPRTLRADLDLLAPLGPVAVFAPDVGQMYGGGDEVTVCPGGRAAGLCGAGRPGHFGGVLTVVAKLFGLVRPDIAVFGRKDAQQFLVIDQMVRDLRMPLRVIDAPTVREPDDLAMSSRNRYLGPEDRRRARALYAALSRGRDLLVAGQRDPGTVRAAMMEMLDGTDAPEYAEVRSVPDLTVPETVGGRTLLAVAARVGAARLIDNFVLEVGDDGVRACGLQPESLP